MARERTTIPGWVGIVFAIIFLVILAALSQFLSKWLKLPEEGKDTLLWGTLGLVLGVALLAALIGVIVGRVVSNTAVVEATSRCEECLNHFIEAANRLREDLASAVGHSAECGLSIVNLRQCLDALGQIILQKTGALLITYGKMREIEGAVAPGSEVWVLTSALELEDTELRDVIRSNLKKRVKYKYLIPEERKALQGRMETLAQAWQRDCGLSADEASEQIQCFVVPGHYAYMTVIVYEALGDPATVLVKFPTSEVYPEQKYPLIYRVADKPRAGWSAFVESLQALIHKDSKCPERRQLSLKFTPTPTK